ncbi:MAG: hypothetical protein SF029_20605 [bacterium]|nr:hypothetical protein [bacterium]
MKNFSIMLHRFIILIVFSAMGTIIVTTQEENSILPQPSGQYQVGRAVYGLSDSERTEVFTEDEEDNRSIVLTVYYPGTPAESDTPVSYLSQPEAEAFAQVTGIPATIFDNVQTHAYADIPVAPTESGYPVLLFSPGMGLPTQFFTSLFEELASRGYVVAAISHSYSLLMTVFPDGSVVTILPQAASVNDPANRDLVLDVWTQDMRFVLDELTRLNEEDALLAGTLNLSQVGAFGHSFGGATATNAMVQDERIQAVADLDGALYNDAAENGVDRPFILLLAGDQPQPTDAELAAAGITREQVEAIETASREGMLTALESAPAGYEIVLEGAFHNTFATDLPFWGTRLPGFGEIASVGTLDANTSYQVITEAVAAFFDEHVRDAGTDLVEEAVEPFTDITFTQYGS